MDSATAAQSWDISRLLANAGVVCGFIGVLIRYLILKRRNKPTKQAVALDGLIGAFYTAAALPVGLFLICCAFKPDLIKYLNNLNLALAAAGLSSVYLAYKGIVSD